jgi:hypothetical protein
VGRRSRSKGDVVCGRAAPAVAGPANVTTTHALAAATRSDRLMTRAYGGFVAAGIGGEAAGGVLSGALPAG